MKKIEKWTQKHEEALVILETCWVNYYNETCENIRARTEAIERCHKKALFSGNPEYFKTEKRQRNFLELAKEKKRVADELNQAIKEKRYEIFECQTCYSYTGDVFSVAFIFPELHKGFQRISNVDIFPNLGYVFDYIQENDVIKEVVQKGINR